MGFEFWVFFLFFSGLGVRQKSLKIHFAEGAEMHGHIAAFEEIDNALAGQEETVDDEEDSSSSVSSITIKGSWSFFLVCLTGLMLFAVLSSSALKWSFNVCCSLSLHALCVDSMMTLNPLNPQPHTCVAVLVTASVMLCFVSGASICLWSA